MRAVQLVNYFLAGCTAFSLLGWIASTHPMTQKAIALLITALIICWGLSWISDYSLSKLLKIEVHELQAHLVAIGAMLIVGLGIFLCA